MNAHSVRAHSVESLSLLEQRDFAAGAHIVDEHASDLRRCSDVYSCARNESSKFHSAGLLVAEVNRVNHGLTMLVRDDCGNIARDGMIDTHVWMT